MPPKPAKRVREDPQQEPLTDPTVRSILSRNMVKICDLISQGHEPSENEETLYRLAKELQRGFQDLKKRQEDLEREEQRRWAVLEQAEAMVNRLVAAAEAAPQPSAGRPRPRHQQHQEYRNDYRERGGERDRGYRPPDSRMHPSRAAPPPAQWEQPPSSGYGTPPYTPSSPRLGAAGGAGVADLLNQLSSATAAPQNDASRPY